MIPSIYDGFHTSKRWLFGISEPSTVWETQTTIWDVIIVHPINNGILTISNWLGGFLNHQHSITRVVFAFHGISSPVFPLVSYPWTAGLDGNLFDPRRRSKWLQNTRSRRSNARHIFTCGMMFSGALWMKHDETPGNKRFHYYLFIWKKVAWG